MSEESKLAPLWHLIGHVLMYATIAGMIAGGLYVCIIDKENTLAALALITGVVALLEAEKKDIEQ